MIEIGMRMPKSKQDLLIAQKVIKVQKILALALFQKVLPDLSSASLASDCISLELTNYLMIRDVTSSLQSMQQRSYFQSS